MKHNLTWFSIFFEPAKCRLVVQFYENGSGGLNFNASIFHAQKADSTDYVIQSREREHMARKLRHAFGQSRIDLLDPFLDKLEVLQ